VLFFEDTNRIAPFTTAATVPDSTGAAVNALSQTATQRAATRSTDAKAPIDSATLTLSEQYMEQLKKLPWVKEALKRPDDDRGSNEFAISGRLSITGQPILANDPHLSLGTPSTFYENHLRAPGFDAIGSSFPGTPYVTLGHNDRVAWGATVDSIDVTDVYQEQIVPDPNSSSGLSTVYKGTLEPVVALPQVFRVNTVGDGVQDSIVVVPPSTSVPAATLILPRRNNGPLIAVNMTTGVGLSVQYTGFSGTREFDAFRGFNLARDLNDFVTALQGFDTGSQNFAYADVRGNIAYFASGELPLREDLEAGAVAGLSPYFVRNGQGGNEWLPAVTKDRNRAIPFEILPFNEMPHVVNPANGFFVNANNDPTGNTIDNDVLNVNRPNGGILYLSGGFDLGIRAERITELLAQPSAQKRRLSSLDLQRIQADVVLGDAKFFAPIIVQALANAQRAGAAPELAGLAADPRVQEAVSRLAAWDYSAPTGIVEGFDASDRNGVRSIPSDTEIAHSIAATLYSVWRNQIVAQTLATTLGGRGLPLPSESSQLFTALKHLLENFDTDQGIGASGINFFDVPGVTLAQDRRDIIVLRSLTAALTELAGPSFADAFNRSVNQQDYRWGKLHRIVFAHPMGGPFNTPPAGGAFPQPLPGLPGIPVDGGLFTVDAANHSVGNNSSNGFMFSSGPSRRFVAQVQFIGRGIEAVSSLPGGESGVLGDPLHVNLLPLWLTNDVYPLRQDIFDLPGDIIDVDVFVPAHEQKH
jgi:penicillin G amidase